MKTLYPSFRENVLSNQLIHEHDTVILGFSGGKDSVCLLMLLMELRKELAFRLVAAYFNHRLRTDASEEEKWIRQFCRERGVELAVGSKNVIRFRDEHKLNLEHAASLSRYTFFQQVSGEYPNARVATAHTRSDLTETFFIKLFRGSGLQGLSTIYSKKENTIIRPLLVFDQEEILAFLERNAIPYYRDYTNDGDQFLRNRIRHHVVPEVKNIEPLIHRHIYKTVSIIQDEYDYFSETAKGILAKGLLLGKVLPAAILKKYHVALQRHIVREYVRMLKGNLLNIDFVHIESVRTRHAEVGGLAIPGVELTFHKGYIYPKNISVPDYRYTIPAPGTYEIKEIGQTMEVKKRSDFREPRDNHRLIVPYTSVTFPLTVRSPQRADKYTKINSCINQKVIEMIRTSGIPADIRNCCPVLLNGDGAFLWVKGSPLAEEFKVVNRNDKEFLTIEWKKLLKKPLK
jgi:tRNA(Ile)-lysidine synthase